MKRTEKEQLVTELTAKINGATAFYYTDFTGLNVKKMTELRRRFCHASGSTHCEKCLQRLEVVLDHVSLGGSLRKKRVTGRGVLRAGDSN